MAKSSIIEPEVLPSNVHRVDISTSGGHLAGIAEQLRQDVAELELKKQEATWLALRIGMMLLQAKKDVEHGQYEEWVAAEVPQLGRSQAGNYRRLAEAFIEVNELPQAKAVALRLVDVMSATWYPRSLARLGEALASVGEHLPAEQAKSLAEAGEFDPKALKPQE
jgi:hypothetical protein